MTSRQQLATLAQRLMEDADGSAPATVRPFGDSPADLAIDFRMSRRPELITELLMRCCSWADGASEGRERLLRMPVGMRIEALLAMAALTETPRFSWRVRCGSCAEESEFELSVEQILSIGSEQRDLQTARVRIGKMEAQVRRPTGLDQMQWLTGPEGLTSEAMLRSILVAPALDDLLAAGESVESVAAAIDVAMDTFDPALAFRVRVHCPQCEAETEVFPDLAGAALERLSRVQQTSIENVHRLASHYHWSEGEILDLPGWRRQSYLDLIEGETL